MSNGISTSRSQQNTRSHSVAPTTTRTANETRTHTQIPRVEAEVGLSSAVLSALSVESQAVSAIASVLGGGAPTAALSMSRGVAVLQLVGCPRFAPDGRRWIVQDPGFAWSLLVGVAVGDASGAYYRAGVLSFVALVAAAVLAGLLLRGSVPVDAKAGNSNDSRNDAPVLSPLQQQRSDSSEEHEASTLGFYPRVPTFQQ